MVDKVYGIDLGTTYSCIAHIDQYGRPEIIKNGVGEETTASAVYFEQPDSLTIGEIAKSEAIMSPDLVVQKVKSQIGNSDWSFTAHGKPHDATYISSLILKQIATDAAAMLGEPVTDVVITVPAYFGLVEREATKQAGVMAGLNVRSMTAEPVAAALSYDAEKKGDGAVMVYDLGGGTFDVTIIRLEGQEYTTIVTGGSYELGGANWDDVMVGLIVGDLAAQAGTTVDTVENNTDVMNEVKDQAEPVKQQLTSRQSARTSVNYSEGGSSKRYTIEITREAFEQASRHLLDDTIEKAQKTRLEAQGKGVDKLNEILLVGGSTFMPQVGEGLKEAFPDLAQQLHDPNLAVAKGAALFAAQKPDRDPESGLTKSITNVTPRNFGVVVVGVDPDDPDKEFVSNMIRRNDPVPAEITREFGTVVDKQSRATVVCVENLRDEDHFEYDEQEKLGEALLELNGDLPAHSPVSITLGYTQDGLITMLAQEPSSGRKIESRFEAAGLRSEEELIADTQEVSQITVRG